MPLGPTQGYKVEYNGYTLPGYVQEESFDSQMNIAGHQAAYADGSNSEMTGLQNKVLSLRLKVWEPTYLAAKNAAEQAATMLRSKKAGYADLYVQYDDRHYEAMTQGIKIGKVAGTSVRTLEYDVDFDCRPWLVSDAIFTVSGSGMNRAQLTFDTDQVSRDIDNGGWTYTSIKVSGNDITISGYTAAGDFAGFVSVSGTVANLIIDSGAFTAQISGVNKNQHMRWADYRTYVGPEKTYFTVSGAQLCEVSYHDRWYL